MTDPNFWGPALWNSLHTMTFHYPDQPSETDQRHYSEFFHSLQHVLPCENCRQHFGRALTQTHPLQPALKNQETLTRWLVDLHNSVNVRLGKPVVSYESVKEKYDAIRGKCPTNTCHLSIAATCETPTTRRRSLHWLHLVILWVLLVILLVVYYTSRSRR